MSVAEDIAALLAGFENSKPICAHPRVKRFDAVEVEGEVLALVELRCLDCGFTMFMSHEQAEQLERCEPPRRQGPKDLRVSQRNAPLGISVLLVGVWLCWTWALLDGVGYLWNYAPPIAAILTWTWVCLGSFVVWGFRQS